MCGIAGRIAANQQFNVGEYYTAVSKMVSSMRHRGPDASGILPCGSGVLGACRLAIIGLDAASNQPLRSSDGDFVVVFNGEIFNYVELRAELKDRNHRFESLGDTEVIVHGYEEWGEQVLERLNGMFAIAVLDHKTQDLFIARDRFGIKPLYYAELADSWLFASEPLSLLASGVVEAKLDFHTALDFLKYGVTDFGERTFFRGIHQVPPAHCGTVRAGKLRLRKWYSLPAQLMPKASDPEASPKRGEFARILSDSIRIRFRSDVPVGLLLSGGLDSSAIAALSKDVPKFGELESFTVAFPGSALDESEFADAVAAHLGLHSHTIPARDMNMEMLHECVRCQGEPFISPSVLAQWMIMKTVHGQSLRVLISGQGADEYLGGYQYFDSYALYEFLRTGRALEALRYLSKTGSAARSARAVVGLIYAGAPASFRLAPWRKRWLKEDGHDVNDCEYSRALRSARTLLESSLFHLTNRLPQLLRFEDRNSMEFSIETRHPFLDHRLIEWALSAPNQWIIGEGVRKKILRDAVVGLLPRKVLERREKIGFQTPHEWLGTAEFRSELDSLISQAPPELSVLIDFPRLLGSAGRTQSRRRNLDLWRVFNLLLWYRIFVSDSQG